MTGSSDHGTMGYNAWGLGGVYPLQTRGSKIDDNVPCGLHEEDFCMAVRADDGEVNVYLWD